MSAQPIHSHTEPDREPRNAEGIAAAPEDAEGVLRRWWCEAMLDTDPSGGRFTEAALNGTLPTTSVAAAIARCRAAGLPVG